jgi:DNA-binding CsgD family transcriptional regulator
MISDAHDYRLFFKFINTFSNVGFKGIDRNDSLLQQLEALMEYDNQFFFIGDIIQIQILFTSKRSVEMIGVLPEEVTPYNFFEATHPDDIQRHSLGRLKLLKMAQDLFIEQKGSALLSTNMKFRNQTGNFSCLLVQCYIFYVAEPYNTVYEMQVHTDVDWCKKIHKGYHYYVGNDMSYFRYPDEKLMNTGHIFSKREFEIIRQVERGLSSEEIGKKLFISKHTVNTHRSKILRKTGKANLFELIHELKETGVI